MVLHITLSREKSINDKSPMMFVLATVYRPPRHHTYFIKEFADFLSELVLAADKVLIVGDFFFFCYQHFFFFFFFLYFFSQLWVILISTLIMKKMH